MATVRDVGYSSDDLNVASHTGLLPEYEVGDLLIWICFKDSTAGNSLTLPNGWTQLKRGVFKSNEGLVCYKTATANETPPSTSSSDSDAYMSSLISVKNAGTPTNTYYEQAGLSYESSFDLCSSTKLNGVKIAIASIGGSGGASMSNWGRLLVNEETVGACMIVHYDYTLELDSGETVDVQFSNDNTCGLYSFEIPDDSGDANTKAEVDIQNIDYLHYNSGSIVIPTTPLITSLDGISVAKADSLTYGSDYNFFFYQTSPYFKASRAKKIKCVELTTTSFNSNQGLIVFHIFPTRPKYEKTIGKDNDGVFIALVDSNNNWRAWNVNSAGDDSYNVAPLFTFVLDSRDISNAIDSSGSLDTTDIVKIVVGVRGRVAHSYYSVNRFSLIERSKIYGGSSANVSNINTLIEYYNGCYIKPIQTQGSGYQLSLPVDIGDSVVGTYYKETGKTVEFKTIHSGDKRSLNVRENTLGFSFSLLSGDVVIFDSCTITSESKFKINSENDSGLVRFTGSLIKGTGQCNLESNCEIINTRINKCSTINSIGALLDGCSFNDSTSFDAFDYGVGTVLKNSEFKNYSNAIYMGSDITGTIEFDNVKFDGSGTDIYWGGNSGTLYITLLNGSNPVNISTGGGTVVLQTSAYVRITGIEDNSEVRFYTSDLSSELYGVENSSGGEVEFQYFELLSDVIVTIFNINFLPQRLVLQLNGENSIIPIKQIKDRTYKNA